MRTIFLIVQLETNPKMPAEFFQSGKKQLNNDSQYDQIWSNLSVQTFAINNPSCPLKTASNSVTAGFVAQQIKSP